VGHGIRVEVAELEDAKRGFVLPPRRWPVERSFAWLARFRRLARGDELLPATVAGLFFLAFACLRSIASSRCSPKVHNRR